MTDTFLLTLLTGVFVAGASGLIGAFLVLRKMTLLPDALSHVALPGIALGILFHFEPLLGGLGFLLFAIFLIAHIEHKTKLAAESVTGVLFVTALALGALLIPETELLETFFGDITSLTISQLLFQIVLASIICAFALHYQKRIVLTAIAPELATAARINPRITELLLLLLIALTVTIGISFVGILLMSALSIIPAATARNISSTLRGFFVASVSIACVTLVLGIVSASLWHIHPGIATTLVSAFFFLISLAVKK